MATKITLATLASQLAKMDSKIDKLDARIERGFASVAERGERKNYYRLR